MAQTPQMTEPHTPEAPTSWALTLAEHVRPFPQVQFVAIATEHPSLPKVLRHMRGQNLRIDNSCYLYPVFERPLKALLQALLVRNLATHTELLPPATAQRFAETLCAHVDPESTWLSNANWAQHPTDGFWYPDRSQPFTNHTHDAGFVWLAPDSVGFLWAWADKNAP